MSNLNALGKAMALYEVSHNDQLPRGYETLIQEGTISERALVSPVSGRKPPVLRDGKLVGEVDYVLLPLPSGARGDLILAYERPENYRGKGTCVLYRSFSVTWVNRPQFERDLARTQKYLRDHAPPPVAGGQ